MTEQNIKKGIFICRIIVVVSGVLELILMAVLSNSDIGLWSDSRANTVKVMAYILWGLFVISLAVFVGLRVKIKSIKENDRIKQLEDEVKRLKNG